MLVYVLFFVWPVLLLLLFVVVVWVGPGFCFLGWYGVDAFGLLFVFGVGWACLFHVLFGEFDPGSGRTLAACLTHASRTVMPWLLLGWMSGERVSNT